MHDDTNDLHARLITGADMSERAAELTSLDAVTELSQERFHDAEGERLLSQARLDAVTIHSAHQVTQPTVH